MKQLSEFGRFNARRRRQLGRRFIHMVDATGIPREELNKAELGESLPEETWVEPIAEFLELNELQKKRLLKIVRAQPNLQTPCAEIEIAVAAFHESALGKRQ